MGVPWDSQGGFLPAPHQPAHLHLPGFCDSGGCCCGNVEGSGSSCASLPAHPECWWRASGSCYCPPSNRDSGSSLLGCCPKQAAAFPHLPSSCSSGSSSLCCLLVHPHTQGAGSSTSLLHPLLAHGDALVCCLHKHNVPLLGGGIYSTSFKKKKKLFSLFCQLGMGAGLKLHTPYLNPASFSGSLDPYVARFSIRYRVETKITQWLSDLSNV